MATAPMRDEDPAEDQREDDADDQHGLLRGGRHPEARHDQHEDEQVVEAEGVLGEVAGDELPRVLLPPVPPDERGEREGQGDVEDHPAGGLVHARLVRAAGDHPEVGEQDRHHAAHGRDPDSGRDLQRGALRTMAAAGCGGGRAVAAAYPRRPCGPVSPSAASDMPAQLLLELVHLVAQPGGQLELQVRGGRVHLVGQLLDQVGEVARPACRRGRRRAARPPLGEASPAHRRLAPRLAGGRRRRSAGSVSASSRASRSVMSAIFLRSGCGSMPCSVL